VVGGPVREVARHHLSPDEKCHVGRDLLMTIQICRPRGGNSTISSDSTAFLRCSSRPHSAAVFLISLSRAPGATNGPRPTDETRPVMILRSFRVIAIERGELYLLYIQGETPVAESRPFSVQLRPAKVVIQPTIPTNGIPRVRHDCFCARRRRD
jgi:hypothetical protein